LALVESLLYAPRWTVPAAGAVSALHAQAASTEETDWDKSPGLYEQLRRFNDTPIIASTRLWQSPCSAGPQKAWPWWKNCPVS